MQKIKRSFIVLKKGFMCPVMAGMMIASSLLFCGCSVNPKEDDSSVQHEFTVSAPKYKDLQKFSHWEDAKGNTVSEELTYSYESQTEQNYHPVYVDFVEMQGVLLDNTTKYDAAAKRYDSTNDPKNGWLKMGYLTEPLTKGMFVEFTVEKPSGTHPLAWGISAKERIEAYNASPTTNGWLTKDPTNDLSKLFVAEYNIYSGASDSSGEAAGWLTQVSDISQESCGKTKFTNPSVDLKAFIENNRTIKVKYVFDDRLLMYVNGQLFTATNIPDWSIADDKEYHLSFSGSDVKMSVSDIGYDEYMKNKGNYSTLRSDPLTEDAFHGKTITFLGDSITVGVGVSDPRSDNRYSSVLAASLGMTEINMGISGTVMCTGGHRASRLADIQNISYSSDYVGVLLGVNDYDQCRNNDSAKYYSLGEFGSKDTTTIYGALDKMCSDLVNRFRETDTKIFLMTPVVTKWNSSMGVQYWDNNKLNACGYSLRDLCDAMEEVAAYYGIVTLDLNELCEMSESDFSDGLHPNDAGAQKMANTVKEFLLANYSFE